MHLRTVVNPPVGLTAEKGRWAIHFQRIMAPFTILSTHANRQGVDISVTVCLFVFCVFVWTVMDFSAADKASGIKFCMAVHRHARQGIFHFCEVYSSRSPKSDESASAWRTMNVPVCNFMACLSSSCRRRIGMCGYTAVPKDGRTCFILS